MSSKIAATEQLKILQQSYLEKLPAALGEIEKKRRELYEACTIEKLDMLRRLVHKLSGSAGVYGFREISSSARSLDQFLSSLHQQKQLPGEPGNAEIDALLRNLSFYIKQITAK